MLVEYGFEKNNFFVCDLKKALVDKQQAETMYDYPSYKRFHDYIISEMISADLFSKYHGIKENWKKFFKESISRIEDQIFDFEKNVNDSQQYRKIIQNKIKSLEAIQISDSYIEFESLKSEFKLMESLLCDAYVNNRKGLFKQVRLGSMMEAYKEIGIILKKCNDDIIENITDYYTKIQGRITFYAEVSNPGLIDEELKKSLAVLELAQLKKCIEEADSETWFYNKAKKHNIYTGKFSTIINNGYKQTIKNANELCKEYCGLIQKFKGKNIREKESALKGLLNEKEMKNHIEKLNTVKENLSKLQFEFKKINFD